jgi:acetyltransferase
MTIRNLDALFRPKSVAVIGASDRAHSIGALVMRNILVDAFDGPVAPVNPKHATVQGLKAYPDVGAVPFTPDLAVICTPAPTVPGLIADLGNKGTRAAIVLSAGLEETGKDGKTLQQAMLEAARPHLLRILGPNCLGLLAPSAKLNASFAPSSIPAGRLAFAAQSGAMCTAVLDWALDQDIGFSHFISMGNMADIDFGDVIDYLATDPETAAILLYIESVTAPRKFISAARAAARAKPIIAIKAGRAAEAAKAAHSHTGALAGWDAVYDAALKRAGILRVGTTEDLFDAAETLARVPRFTGDRLMIVTNGGGPGVLAVDELIRGGGRLAPLSDETIAALDKVLPETWSRANPVDIIGDAPGARYRAALEILSKSKDSDAVLILHAPTAVSSATEVAETVIAAAMDLKDIPIFTNWLGGHIVGPARQKLRAAGLATFDTPDSAITGFLQTVANRRNLDALIETPSSVPTSIDPDREAIRASLRDILKSGRTTLTLPESMDILEKYGVPAAKTRTAKTPEDARRTAAGIGFPVAIKLLSRDISHKSDVGGVALNVETEAAAEQAAHDIVTRVKRHKPDATIDGFLVQQMAVRPGSYELIAGAATDKVFGPVILFGQGGIAVEVVGDRAIALPPLNMALARQLIDETRIAKLLKGFRDQPPVNFEAIESVLVHLAQLVVDIPEIQEIDINPLLADKSGVLALDARMRIAEATGKPTDRLAILPYPKSLEEEVTLRSGRKVLMRPIRPEDEAAHIAFFGHLSDEDVRFRFFGLIRHASHQTVARFTQIDYDREMAFIATAPGPDGTSETLGVARALSDPDNVSAEFGIIVRSDLKGEGMGYALMTKLIAYARAKGLKRLSGTVVAENKRMIEFAKSLGFTLQANPEDRSAVIVSLDL